MQVNIAVGYGGRQEIADAVRELLRERAAAGASLEVKGILTDRNIEFEYIEDVKTLMIVANKARIMSAPVIEYNDSVYTMEAFLKVI